MNSLIFQGFLARKIKGFMLNNIFLFHRYLIYEFIPPRKLMQLLIHYLILQINQYEINYYYKIRNFKLFMKLSLYTIILNLLGLILSTLRFIIKIICLLI